MSRLMILGAFALAGIGLPLAPAAAQPDHNGYESSSSPAITVTGPHSRRVGRSATGAPIVMHEAAQWVDYSDLDLRTSMDRERLNFRIDVAANEACSALDDAYPTGLDTMVEPRDCRADAVRRAQSQVRDAIHRAGSYRY